VPAWVVARGLLDAAVMARLYLAARSLMGPLGGMLTALLYAARPSAWQLSRDPDGSLGPVLTAATPTLTCRCVDCRGRTWYKVGEAATGERG
jgi:hypothetical protein